MRAPAEMPGLCGAGIAWDAEQHRSIVNRQAYRTGEKAAGISSLFSCRMGRTPVSRRVSVRPWASIWISSVVSPGSFAFRTKASSVS